MLFANKKEEVLDLQLTPHGRYLLSLGKMKPVYYSFHDNNILYDGRYASVEEYAKDIEDRIQHDTPQLKTVISRVSREQNVKRTYEPPFSFKNNNAAVAMAQVEQMDEQKHFLTTHPLGSCSPTTDKAPKWSVKILNGEISGSNPYLTSSYQTLQVPQIDIDIIYKTSILNAGSTTGVPPEFVPDLNLLTMTFDDGSYIAIDPDHLLLEVLEENTEYNKANVEVEVYEILKEDMTSARAGLAGSRSIKDRFRPLYFEKKRSLIKDNILLDEDAIPETEELNLNHSMVDYFFNVLVDEEIDTDELCAAQATLDTKNLYVDLDVTCGTVNSLTRYSIYDIPPTDGVCDTPTTPTPDECPD